MTKFQQDHSLKKIYSADVLWTNIGDANEVLLSFFSKFDLSVASQCSLFLTALAKPASDLWGITFNPINLIPLFVFVFLSVKKKKTDDSRFFSDDENWNSAAIRANAAAAAAAATSAPCFFFLI